MNITLPSTSFFSLVRTGDTPEKEEIDEAAVMVLRRNYWRNASLPGTHEVAAGLISGLSGDRRTQASEIFLRMLRKLV